MNYLYNFFLYLIIMLRILANVLKYLGRLVLAILLFWWWEENINDWQINFNFQKKRRTLRENPICIIIPCHRVIGKNKRLVGYGGGLNNKTELLNLEKMNKKEIN